MIAVTVYQLNMCWCLKVNILMPFIINIINSAPQRAEEVITFSATLIKFYSTLFHPGNVSLLITPRTLICIYMYIIFFFIGFTVVFNGLLLYTTGVYVWCRTSPNRGQESRLGQNCKQIQRGMENFQHVPTQSVKHLRISRWERRQDFAQKSGGAL